MYRTFIRSCRNWQEFARARKRTDMAGLSYEAARDRCQEYNQNLTRQHVRRGTKMEFTKED